MRFVSWNVNGLRAVMKKGFPAVFDELNADVFALQETKLQEGIILTCQDIRSPGAMPNAKAIQARRSFLKKFLSRSFMR